MSTDQTPPGVGADEAPQPVPVADPVTSATDKSGNGTESGATDTTPPSAEREPSILEELGVPPEPEEPEDPPDDGIHKPEPEAEKATDPQDEPKPDEELKPEDEAKPGFARKHIKNLNKERKKLQEELEAVRPAAQALSVMQDLVTKAGFVEGKQALDAMSLIGRALNAKDPEAQAELFRLLQDSGAKLPEPPQAPELDATELAIVADVDSLHGPEESKKLAARLLATKKPTEAAQKAPPPPPEQKPQAAHQDVENRVGQAELSYLIQAVRGEHGKAADEILTEVFARINKKDRAHNGGLHPRVWSEVFIAERESVLAARRKAARPQVPTHVRSTPPKSNHDGPKSTTQEVLEA